MTEQPQTPPERPNTQELDYFETPRDSAIAVLRQLSEIIGPGEDSPASVLNFRQQALLNDTRGLLSGISNGRVPTGVQRIRDNLVEMLAGFDTVETHSDLHGKCAAVLNRALEMASVAGLTVDGNTFPRAQSRALFSRDR